MLFLFIGNTYVTFNKFIISYPMSTNWLHMVAGTYHTLHSGTYTLSAINFLFPILLAHTVPLNTFLVEQQA